jgi:hypothetical protein
MRNPVGPEVRCQIERWGIVNEASILRPHKDAVTHVQIGTTAIHKRCAGLV